MAALIKKPLRDPRRKGWVVQFTARDGKRPKVSLGCVSRKVADEARRHIEHLVLASITGAAPDRTTAEWLDSLSDKLYQRLVRAGLVAAREAKQEPESLGLGEWIDRYIETVEQNLRPNTVRKFQQARRALVGFFGEGKPITAITGGDAEDFKHNALAKHAEATVATHIKCAKQLFGYAVKHRKIAENPFAETKAGSQHNERRRQEVRASVIRRAIAHAPNDEWRLIIALARFGGLRIPSELGELKWTDVDIANAKFTVRSPKLARHSNGGVRVVPLFFELREYFESARASAESDATYVVPRASARNATLNLRTQFLRILKAADISPWPKLFQNLRASRETELLEAGFTIHEVRRWLGNSPLVALKHYIVTTQKGFTRATEERTSDA